MHRALVPGSLRHRTLLAFLALVLFYYQALCVCLSIMINLFIVLVGTLAAFSFADADPHVRKDFKSLLSSAQENHNDSLGRTLEANKDRILKLPGLDSDASFDQFSGYLTVDQHHQRNVFYWFVESQNDPKNDPVVLWTNGGPGCSGLLGLGTEHGPFIIHKNGTLTPNPHSWNKVANILYVEQPAGVGFSYSNVKEDYTTGDAQAAIDNYAMILEFLTRFPERQGNPFYIASESYGGHYMPQLAMEILNQNTDDSINFKGFLVGNPYVDPFSNTLTQFASFYAHGLVAKPLYDKFVEKCSTPKTLASSTCYDLQSQMRSEFGEGINPYALDFPVCTEDKNDSPNAAQRTTSSTQSKLLLSLMDGPPFLPQQDEYNPCQEEHLHTYLNRWGVQTALHAHVGSKWKACSDTLHYDWKDVNTAQIHLYTKLVEMGKTGNQSLDILIYSGDDDSVCSTTGTQEWIYDLNVGVKKDQEWEPWSVGDQTAGFYTKFDMGNNVDATLTFVTVHGAGHEVPAYRPMESLELFRKYLARDW